MNMNVGTGTLAAQDLPRKSRDPTRDPTARRRTARLACDFCHRKKTKCDGSYPCSNCKKRQIDCLWAGGAPVNLIAGSYTPEYVKWLEQKVSDLSGSTKALEEGKKSQPALPQHSPSPPRDASPSVTPSQPWQASARFGISDEVAGINHHTKNQEFYGSSSSVALLARVGRSQSKPSDDGGPSRDEAPDTLLTSLHNPVFSPLRVDGGGTRGASHPTTASPLFRVFIDGFFSSLHHIFPILDKTIFMRRCENLWTSEGVTEVSSFVALYFSVLSLGALVGPRAEEPINGEDNLTWSRKFFEESRSLCSALGMITDLDMVQCYFFLSKVTQNELNPHLTYMYVGLAVRTALAIGINRAPSRTSRKDPEIIKAETRTWWGLYSLETELSFGMGRPDTLGADSYHNRPFPVTTYTASGFGGTDTDQALLEPPQCAILQLMVDFSRIIRRIHLELYMAEPRDMRDPALTVHRVASIEHDLHAWLQNLPAAIKPQPGSHRDLPLKSAKEPQYVKKQKLVLTIRYHNLRILLFGSFLLQAAGREELTPFGRECAENCLISAKETIDIIYDTYKHQDYFRTWFYNTTYTVFASSMILLYIQQVASDSELPSVSRYVEMAIEILEVMDESVIALKSAAMIKRALERANKQSRTWVPAAPVPESDLWLPTHHYWGSLNLLDGQLDEGFPFQISTWPE